MKTKRSKSKRSRRSGNTYTLDRIEHSRNMTIGLMKTNTSKGKKSKRRGTELFSPKDSCGLIHEVTVRHPAFPGGGRRRPLDSIEASKIPPKLHSTHT